MPELLSKIKHQAVDFWTNLEKSQRIRIIITSAVVIAVVTISMILLTRPSYITLISDADPKQVGEMIAILDDNNIWNKAEDNGKAIVINSKDNNKAQIALAQKGYPKGGLTFEDAISFIGLTTTESDKKHIWRQQKISDIATKLEMLDNVETATVNIAIPERSVFVTSDEEQSKPTAYVMVKPKDKLTPEQVEGIVMLVSRSVEGLNPDDVTVVDNNSNILNAQIGDELIEIANSQEEMRLKREIELQKKVYDYFNVGQYDTFDTLRVVANVVLDFDKEKSQIKSISVPDGLEEGALISRDSEQIDLKNGSVSGVPGMETNPGTTDSVSYQIGEDENSTYREKHDIENYEYDEKLSELEKATGKMIPEESSMAISLWYGKKVPDDTGLTEEFINQVRLAASSATGIPAKNISISKLKMATPEVVEPTTAEIIKELMSEYGFFVVILFLVIGLLIAVLSGKKQQQPQLAAVGEAAATLSPYDVAEEEKEEVPEIDTEERSEVKKQIEKFAQQKPEAVAQLLRNWLSDDWDG